MRPAVRRSIVATATAAMLSLGLLNVLSITRTPATVAPNGAADAQRPPILPEPSPNPGHGILASRFGTSDTSAYEGARLTRLTDRPSLPAEFAAVLSGESSYLGLRTPEELAWRSELVVRAKIVSFSAPYWNSQDGSFWATRYVPESAGTPVANELFRDVDIEVVEVLGSSRKDAEAKVLTITVPGGQAVVTIPPAAAALEPTFLPAGRYVWSFEPPTDLVIGEEAVLFLTYRSWYGLFGDRYAYEVKLQPANERYWKFAINEDDGARNAALRPDVESGPFVTTVESLKLLAGSGAIGAAIKDPLLADGKVHPVPGHPADEPVVAPPDEQDGAPTPPPGEDTEPRGEG